MLFDLSRFGSKEAQFNGPTKCFCPGCGRFHIADFHGGVMLYHIDWIVPFWCVSCRLERDKIRISSYSKQLRVISGTVECRPMQRDLFEDLP
jgi:hypothetical protein